MSSFRLSNNGSINRGAGMIESDPLFTDLSTEVHWIGIVQCGQHSFPG